MEPKYHRRPDNRTVSNVHETFKGFAFVRLPKTFRLVFDCCHPLVV